MKILPAILFLFFTVAVSLVLLFVDADTLYPTFHVRPLTNWINDPNFPFRHPETGIIHLFCQYNEYQNSTTWGNMSIAHMMSRDYVTWQHLPVALRPGPESYDKGGVFSGSATFIPSTSGPVMLYTCVDKDNVERQCLATPTNSVSIDPTMQKWTKSPLNPIIDSPPPNGVRTNFRDPSTGWHQKMSSNNPSSSSSAGVLRNLKNKKNQGSTATDDYFYVAFAAQIGKNGTVVTYRFKPDMSAASFHSVLYQPTKTYEEMVECPDVFLSDVQPDQPNPNFKNVFLKDSNMEFRQDFYRMGVYNEDTIQFEEVDPFKNFLDFGNFYASKTFWDPVDNMRVLFGWINEDGYKGGQGNDVPIKTNWAGAQSLPRRVTYNKTFQKLQTPPLDALSNLRTGVIPGAVPANAPVTPQKFYTITPAGNHNTGLAHEIYVSLDIPQLSAFNSTETSDYNLHLHVLASEGGEFNTKVGINIPSGQSTAQVENADNPDFDILDLPIPPAHANETEQEQIDRCRILCEGNPACLSFTYVRKGHNGGVPPYDYSPRCSMKGRDFDPTLPRPLSPCCVSARVRKPRVVIDRTHSNSLGSRTTVLGRASTLVVTKSNPAGEIEQSVVVNLRVFVDHSFVEVYHADGLDVGSTRVYVENPNQNGIYFVADIPVDTPENYLPVMKAGLVYPLKSIWNQF